VIPASGISRFQWWVKEMNGEQPRKREGIEGEKKNKENSNTKCRKVPFNFNQAIKKGRK